MRISTNQIHSQGLNSILQQQAKLIEKQLQIASGQRIQKPSDDPVGASQIVLLQEQINKSERFQINTDIAEGNLALEDNVLASITNIIQRVRELTVQANSTVLSDNDRAAVNEELNERLGELAGLANTRDADGSYIFAGYKTQNPAYTKNAQGVYTYNGDNGQRFLEVAHGMQIPISDPGNAIFDGYKRGNGTFRVADSGATNTGTAVIGATSVSDPSAYVADTYTITFVTNSSGELAYQVVGATSGQVIPPLPAVIPDDAPAYVADSSITFNGIDIPISGTPVVGDDFQVIPSGGQSIFQTVNNIIGALTGTIETPTQVAAMQNALNEGLVEIDQALDQVIFMRTKVGARLNAIDTAKNTNEDFIIQSQSLLSKVQDLDFASAVTEFESQTVALEAAQRTFITLRNLNLFNFLR